MKTTFLALMLLIIPGLSHAKPLTKDELLKIGVKQIECTVTSVGSFNFLATSTDGKEINFNTDDNTIQFEPENERLVVGDRVSVLYIEAMSPSQSKDKTHAIRVEWLQKAPRNFLNGEISCVVTPLKYRNGYTCYVESIQQIIRFEGQGDSAFTPVIGDRLIITLKAVPASIGNGYVYKCNTMKIFVPKMKIN